MLEWLQNPYVAIGLAVGAMFFGYFFGLFEGRGQGYKRRQAEEEEKAETAEPQVEVAPPPPAAPVLPPDETSLLDVSRDGAGTLRLRVDGQRIEATALNPEQRKRIIAILTLIRPWLESPTSAPPAVRPSAAGSAPVRPAPVPEARPVEAARPVLPPEIEEDEAAPLSIVAQIDSILHAQLAGTPLMDRGIRLQESPEGGVIVWVGMQKFTGIEDVPDEEIKAAIRAAIRTWENKYTPGI